MKIFSTEHTFNHPWKTIVAAAVRKYPNPLTPNVSALDVIERDVKRGVLCSKRLMTTEWGFPLWAQRLVGIDGPCYVAEYSEVNPDNNTMTLNSRNLSYNKFVNIDEHLTYEEHPDDSDKTVMKQEFYISVKNLPFTGQMEGILQGACSSNADKGPKAMEWVISNVVSEAEIFQKNMQEKIVSEAEIFQKNMQEKIAQAEVFTKTIQEDLCKNVTETIAQAEDFTKNIQVDMKKSFQETIDNCVPNPNIKINVQDTVKNMMPPRSRPL